MNNGKVRIYELSRELNLDNKDILSICEGLNIAVKSHSSTITESQAERIRAAAEKYASRPSAVNNRDGAEANAGSSSKQSIGRPKDRRKQQILEIKHKPRSASNLQQGSSQVATPPQPPSRPTAATPPSESVQPKRPERPDGEETRLEPEEESQPEVAEESNAPTSLEEKPQLIEPPARPKPPKPQLTQVERPILKRDRAESPPAKTSEAPEPTKPPSAPSSPPAKPEPATAERRAPAKPSVPELQRPQKRAKTAREELKPTKEEPIGEDVAEEEDTAIETPEIIERPVRRPTPPRQKTKIWEDESADEDGKEAKTKGKGKLKRRPQPILDEEDEEELEDRQQGQDDPAKTSSVAIARPPKPKSSGSGQPTAAPSAAQRRRPVTRGSDRDSGRAAEGRDRRRDKKEAPERPETIVLSGSLTVRELANALEVPETEIIKKLFFKGLAVNITQTLDVPTAKMVAEEFGTEVETAEEKAAAAKVTEMLDAADLEYLVRRPPVVTIMGHVDHGKTTLLDAIRETKVAQGEAGGITQHIGAYHVDVEHEGEMQQVVFLDTPGHEAFTAMRARGTRVTDIAVLVVAADDGVRPQTIEAISHAKAAEVPLVIAINKIDKEGASPDRVKQELTEQGLVPEEWGGDTIMVPVSAIKGENLDTLLEMILLVSDIEELSANPERSARGTVIEANLDKARGPVATLLVQNGTLHVGDILVAGSVFGRVRAMIDDRGHRVEAASPSFAVEVLGLNDVPAAGDEFAVYESEKEARSVAEAREEEQRQSRLQQVMASRRVSLNSLSAQAQEGELKELNLILKADVQGSVEAILGALRQLPQNEVQVRVLLAAAGEITETDIDLAAASGAVIIGFSTGPTSSARQAAEREGVDVREYNVIYKLLDEIQGAMEGLLEPELVEEPLGQVEVRAVFTIGRGAVAGCYVQSGKVIRNCRIRVHRGGQVVYEGALDSLKRVKDDVKEVNAGFECGIGVNRFNDWQEGDIIEAFKMVSKRRTLSAT